jgi:DNA modification methylase
LVTYVGQHSLPAVLPLLCEQLLWFVKGESRATNTMLRDSVRSEPGNKTLDHPWAQGLPEALYYIERLSAKGSLVLDAYLGGGATAVAATRLGRRFIGFEIDPATAAKAEARISRFRPAGETMRARE